MRRTMPQFLGGILAVLLLAAACLSAESEKEKQYKTMTERSLIRTGNSYRMIKAIEKARRGEEVTIAVIGGSITEGYNAALLKECWAELFAASFRENFAPGDGNTVHLVNAGMAGTPSTLGMLRWKTDVLDRCPTFPDIVVVEFAVNDGDDPSGGAAYESLVRDILTGPGQPAVILLFSVFQSRWNLEDRLVPVGELYDLPMVSIKQAVVPALEEGYLTEEEFFADAFHPTDLGHRIMADCLDAYLRTLRKAPKPEADLLIPDAPAIGKQFSGIIRVDRDHLPAGVLIDPGSFSAKDTALTTVKYDPKRLIFPGNWSRKGAKDNEPFRMTFTGRTLVLTHKRSTAAMFGSAEVYLDGIWVETCEGQFPGAWDNAWTTILLDEPEARSHTLEIRMKEGQEQKNFTILALGYTP